MKTIVFGLCFSHVLQSVKVLSVVSVRVIKKYLGIKKWVIFFHEITYNGMPALDAEVAKMLCIHWMCMNV